MQYGYRKGRKQRSRVTEKRPRFRPPLVLGLLCMFAAAAIAGETSQTEDPFDACQALRADVILALQSLDSSAEQGNPPTFEQETDLASAWLRYIEECPCELLLQDPDLRLGNEPKTYVFPGMWREYARKLPEDFWKQHEATYQRRCVEPLAEWDREPPTAVDPEVQSNGAEDVPGERDPLAWSDEWADLASYRYRWDDVWSMPDEGWTFDNDPEVQAEAVELEPSVLDFLTDEQLVIADASRRPEWQPARPSSRSVLRHLWHRFNLGRFFAALAQPALSVSTHSVSFMNGAAQRPTASVTAASPPETPAVRRPLLVVTNLGRSTGEAFSIQLWNPDDVPVALGGRVLVVEPLTKKAQRKVRQDLAQLVGQRVLAGTVNGYCLEFEKKPPEKGMIFRIARPEVQQRHASMRRILAASRSLNKAGLLRPDSEPRAYFHSIRQWAIWTEEQAFDAAAFADALVEHTHKSVQAAGQPWTDKTAQLVRTLAPHRWEDVQRILEAAQAAPRSRGAGS